MARPSKPTELYVPLTPIFLHLVCRWESFYDQATGGKVSDLKRTLDVLYGWEISYMQAKKTVQRLVDKGWAVNLKTQDGQGQVNTVRSTPEGHQEWLRLIEARGIPTPVDVESHVIGNGSTLRKPVKE